MLLIWLINQLSFGLSLDVSEISGEREETKTSSVVSNITNNPSRKASATEQLVRLTTSALVLPPPSPVVPRDLWTNKVEFLLSVIGYVVDLGQKLSLSIYSKHFPLSFRKRLAFSLHVLRQWRWCLSYSVHDLFTTHWHTDDVSLWI